MLLTQYRKRTEAYIDYTMYNLRESVIRQKILVYFIFLSITITAATISNYPHKSYST